VDGDEDEDGEAAASATATHNQPLHSRVAELIAKRKARQQASDNKYPKASSRAVATNASSSASASADVDSSAVAAAAAAGIPESEARKAFDSYDVNGDGVLDMQEFTVYLTSVFFALQHTEAFQAHGVSPIDMAAATAAQCFAEADADGNGVLSFDEFKDWYSANPTSMGISADASGLISESEAHQLFESFDVNGDGVLDMMEFTAYLTSVFEALSQTEDFQAHGVSPSDMAYATAAECFEEADSDHNGTLSFDEFKVWFRNHPSNGATVAALVANERGQIHEVEAKQVFDSFDANGDGVLDPEEFTVYLTSVFEALAHTEAFQAHKVSPIDMAAATAAQCFAEADADGNGVLSFDEFKNWFRQPGHSVAPHKISANDHGLIEESEARKAFESFDVNGDNVLDFEEFTAYLTSVFEALQHTEDFQAHGVSPEEIAKATAATCFEEADTDGNGVLSFAEFKDWFRTSEDASTPKSGSEEQSKGAEALMNYLEQAQACLEQAAFVLDGEGFDASPDWWLHFTPIVANNAGVEGALPGRLSVFAQQGLAAARHGLGFDSSCTMSAAANGRGSGGGGGGDTKSLIRAALHREEALALLLLGDPAGGVAALDAALGFDADGTGALGGKGFVWGLKARVLEVCSNNNTNGGGGFEPESASETALVCLLRANQLAPGASVVLQDALDDALAANGMDGALSEASSNAGNSPKQQQQQQQQRFQQPRDYDYPPSPSSSSAGGGAAAAAAAAHKALHQKGSVTQDQARDLFHHFDSNGDGVLDLGEFTTYLTSVFDALGHLDSFQAHGATPQEMATATANVCFHEADADGNGTLSFEEFQDWFQTTPMAHAAASAAATANSGVAGGVGEEEDPEYPPVTSAASSSAHNYHKAAAAPSSFSYGSNSSNNNTTTTKEAVAEALKEAELEKAHAVAEVRIRMREILRDEVASLTLQHSEEQASLKKLLEEQEVLFSRAQGQFEGQVAEEQSYERQRRDSAQRQVEVELEATKRKAAEQLSTLQASAYAAARQAEKEAQEASAKAVALAKAEMRQEVAQLEDALAKTSSRCVAVSQAHASLHDQLVEMKGNIRVVCRVRPSMGLVRGACVAQRSSPYEVTLANKTTAASYTFDQVSCGCGMCGLACVGCV
jgi:Ca2+-binding EF-hand superfamily protein